MEKTSSSKRKKGTTATKPLVIQVKSAVGLVLPKSSKRPLTVKLSILGKDGSVIASKKTGGSTEKTDKKVSWNEKVRFDVGSNFSGLEASVWEKRKLSRGKFYGQVVIKFNVELLEHEILQESFDLAPRERKKENVSGSVSLKIRYGAMSSAKSPRKRSSRRSESDDGGGGQEGNEKRKLVAKAKWDNSKTRMVLKTSAYTVIKTREDPEDDYSVVREGPLTLSFKGGSSVSVSGDGSLSASRGTHLVTSPVKVRGGRWFYEVEVTRGSSGVSLGWVSNKFTGIDSEFGWFFSARGLRINAGRSEVWEGMEGFKGSISSLGCSLDLESGAIAAYINGRHLGTVFDFVFRGKEKGAFFLPCLLLDNAVVRERSLDEFVAHVPAGHYPLISTNDEAHSKRLAELFKQYSGDDADDAELEPEATLALATDLDIDIQKDLGLLLIAWKLDAERLWAFTRDEWMLGWDCYGGYSISSMKSLIRKWEKELKSSPVLFKKFYRFCFVYLREDKKVIETREALMIWELFPRVRSWALFPKWKEFLNEYTKGVNIDAWEIFLDFIDEYPSSFDGFDETAAWPSVFDSFYETMTATSDESSEDYEKYLYM